VSAGLRDHFSWLSSYEVWLGSKFLLSELAVSSPKANSPVGQRDVSENSVELCDAREMAGTCPSTSLVSAIFAFSDCPARTVNLHN